MFWRELTSRRHGDIDSSLPVLLPIGSIEQHGPALPVWTDTLIVGELCAELNRRRGDDCLLLPPLSVGYSAHHMDFPGSLSLSHETMIAYIGDITASLVKQGFSTLLIINGHGGNQAVMQLCVEKLGNLHPRLNIMGTSWWKLCAGELAEIRESGFMGNGHAAEFEFSLIEYLRPDLIDSSARGPGSLPDIPLPQARGDLLAAGPVSLLRTFKEMTRDGTYGLTDAASPQKGEAVFQAAVGGLEKLLEDIRALAPRQH